MSALCQKQTFCAAVENVVIRSLIGDGQYSRRDRQAYSFRGLEVDDEIELGASYHRHVSRFLAFENTTGINASQAMRPRSQRPHPPTPRPESGPTLSPIYCGAHQMQICPSLNLMLDSALI
jgi:hypothetical protein